MEIILVFHVNTDYSGPKIRVDLYVALRKLKSQMLVPDSTGTYGSKAVSRPLLLNATS